MGRGSGEGRRREDCEGGRGVAGTTELSDGDRPAENTKPCRPDSASWKPLHLAATNSLQGRGGGGVGGSCYDKAAETNSWYTTKLILYYLWYTVEPF